MRTKKEIKRKKAEDVQFIIAAITTELYNMARLEYFGTWENLGGMGWFFSECVEIANLVMFKKGSPYLKWLKHWSETEGNNWRDFSELTGERCFDWYHMDEARKEFQSRYTKDECTMEEISEHIGFIISRFEGDRVALIDNANTFAEKEIKKAEAWEKHIVTLIRSGYTLKLTAFGRPYEEGEMSSGYYCTIHTEKDGEDTFENLDDEHLVNNLLDAREKGLPIEEDTINFLAKLC